MTHERFQAQLMTHERFQAQLKKNANSSPTDRATSTISPTSRWPSRFTGISILSVEVAGAPPNKPFDDRALRFWNEYAATAATRAEMAVCPTLPNFPYDRRSAASK